MNELIISQTLFATFKNVISYLEIAKIIKISCSFLWSTVQLSRCLLKDSDHLTLSGLICWMRRRWMGRPAGHATRALRLYTGKVTRMRCVSLLMTNKSIIVELCHLVSACFSFLAKSLDIQRFDTGHGYTKKTLICIHCCLFVTSSHILWENGNYALI